MTGIPTKVDAVDDIKGAGMRIEGQAAVNNVHTDAVYVALINAANIMETRLKNSLENYEAHPDVQANLQQLQYDLQSWNLALTTMTNIQKNMADALKSIASNFR
jgi:hypothetical protein